MSPDDKRHGTNPGYNAGCRELCCRRAHAQYRNRLELDNMRGIVRIVPALGTKRRIQSLRAVGWSGAAIMREAGLVVGNLNRFLDAQTINHKTAERFAEVYDRLVDRPVEGTAQSISRARRLAERNGWPTPDRWFDIDDPNEQPDPGWREQPRGHEELDFVVVERILAGDFTLARTATKAERMAVVEAWPESLGTLARLTRWKVERYRKDGAA